MIYPLVLKCFFFMQWWNAPQSNAQKSIVFELLKATITRTPSAALFLSHVSRHYNITTFEVQLLKVLRYHFVPSVLQLLRWRSMKK